MHKKDDSKVKAGIARARSLTEQQRSAIAKKAAKARWDESTPFATHDGVLELGGADIHCYVLSDDTRIMSTRGVMKALGRAWRGRKYPGTQLPVFLEAKNIKPFIDNELTSVLSPVEFRIKKGGTLAEGFKAEALPLVCEVYLNAAKAGAIIESQISIVQQCEILVLALSKVGVTALVDEATGFQEIRDRRALQKILDKYLTDEWAKWTKTFPDNFYKHLFRLKEVPYPPAGGRKPQYVGHWTNDIVYSRMQPGILKELKNRNPRIPTTGERRRKHHQYFTPDYGHPALKEHLSNVTFLMAANTNWNEFKRQLNKAKPKFGDTIEMDF